MKILHVTPAFFSANGRLGGGERYAYELAKAMSKYEETSMLSFGPKERTWKEGKLNLRLLKHRGSIDGNIVNPWPIGVWSELRKADVIQVYQMRTLLTDMVLCAARYLKKKVFVADMGGWGRLALSYHLNLEANATGYLLLSRDCLPEFPVKTRPLHVLFGGIDPSRFFPGSLAYDSKRVLFVGRSISAKGIDYLIRALPPDMELWIIGQPVDPSYRQELVRLAANKNIRFFEDLSDEELRSAYQTSLVTVLPSVTRLEKLGLVLLESMACGTPVICSRIGGMPEIVEDGRTGWVIPPGNVQALTERILWFRDHPEERQQMAHEGLIVTAQRFLWDHIAHKNLQIYEKSDKN